MVLSALGYLLLNLFVISDATLMRQFAIQVQPADEASGQGVLDVKWFQQKLDHNDAKNSKTWNQRYRVINKYYQHGGPAFLVLVGESASTGQNTPYLAVTAYAKKLNGILFELEHRFYGESKPTSDVSTSNLKYLTVEQALADAASFIPGMNSLYKLAEGTRWIASGGSYGGMLAAWLREKYPETVYAAVSFSGPVLAILNFYQFKTNVRETLKHVNKKCPIAVRDAQLEVRDFVKKGKNLGEFSNKFKLCDQIDSSNKKDLDSLLQSLGDNPVLSVQYNHTYDLTIEQTCALMVDKSFGTLIDRYAELNRLIMKENSKDCLEFKYDKTIAMYKNESWDKARELGGVRQWTYQICTEFGFFQTSYEKTHLVADTITLQFFIDMCADIFGKQFTKSKIQHGIGHTNKLFGGYDIKATRVAYVNGDQDPWRTIGITSTKIPESPAFVTKDESHLTCMLAVTDTDSDTYKPECGQIETLVTQWCKSS